MIMERKAAKGVDLDQFVILCATPLEDRTGFRAEGLASLCYLVWAALPDMARPVGVNQEAGIEPFRIAVQVSPFFRTMNPLELDQNGGLVAHSLVQLRPVTANSAKQMANLIFHLARKEESRIVAAAHRIAEHPEEISEHGIALRQIEEQLRIPAS